MVTSSYGLPPSPPTYMSSPSSYATAAPSSSSHNLSVDETAAGASNGYGSPVRTGAQATPPSGGGWKGAQGAASGALELDFHAALSSGIVRRQEHARAQELVDIRGSVVDLVRQLESSADVDGKFDENAIVVQIDNSLPPVENTMLTEGDRARANLSPGQYQQLEALRKQVAAMIASADSDFVEPYTAIESRIDQVLEVYDGTRNQDGEEEVLSQLRELVKELSTLMAVEIPDTRQLHARAQRTDGRCESFEARRDVVDWTEDMTHAENTLYTEVDSLLDKTSRQAKQSAELLAVLHSMRALSLHVDEERPVEDRSRIKASLDDLNAQEAEEERAFESMSSNLESQLATVKAEHAQHNESITKLETHIRKLLDDLSDAHLNAWRTQKRINAVERSMNLLHKKQRLNTNLAEHEEEEALGLLADSEAQVAVSGMVNNLLDSVTDQFQAIRAKREAKITADVIELSVNRLQLITRKYFKTALSVFAAESSIEILHQEQEAILVKKQRSNAAKKHAWVAECNKNFAEIQSKIDYEEGGKARCVDDMDDLKSLWTEIYDQATVLAVTDPLKAKLGPVKDIWVSTLDQLNDIEKQQLSKIELDNKLDAGFLHNMSFDGSK